MLNKLLADQGNYEVMEEENNPEVEEGAVGVEGSSGIEKTARTTASEGIHNTQWVPEGDGIMNTGQAPVVEVIPETDQGHTPETDIGEIIVHAEFAPEAQDISGDERALQTQGISHTEEVPEAIELDNVNVSVYSFIGNSSCRKLHNLQSLEERSHLGVYKSRSSY